MNLNASPETVQNTAEALKLAALLDDKTGHADKPRIAAWAEQIERHKLSRTDVLDGVQAFYDQPRERAIGIGDLIHYARIVKRDRLEREADVERDARRATVDVKAADETLELAGVVSFGPTVCPTDRLKRAEEALQFCFGRRESVAAVREFFAAKREAAKLAKNSQGGGSV